MSAIRNRIENWFEDLAHLIYRHRVLAIIIMLPPYQNPRSDRNNLPSARRLSVTGLNESTFRCNTGALEKPSRPNDRNPLTTTVQRKAGAFCPQIVKK